MAYIYIYIEKCQNLVICAKLPFFSDPLTNWRIASNERVLCCACQCSS